MTTSKKIDIKSFLSYLTHRPGVYQMLDEKGKILYVGKAKDLKKRVTSYFRTKSHNSRIALLVEKIHDISVVVTHSENEALLLECNLIKQHQPKFNVLFRDDKSYPYIYLSAHPEYPSLSAYRGVRKRKGRYFGPYPSSQAVRETLNIAQKIFNIRSCTDTFFNNRTRPCLQYQIKRCSAPCVRNISAEKYQEDVRHLSMLLEGKNELIMEELTSQMDTAANELNYERAAHYRDQINHLRHIQETQHIIRDAGDLDVVACVQNQYGCCVQIHTIRDGHLLGNKTYFPKLPEASESEEILSAFLAQYYLTFNLQRSIPKQIVVNIACKDKDSLQSVLTENAGYKVHILHNTKGDRAQWLKIATQSAEHALQKLLPAHQNYSMRLKTLQELLQLQELPHRMECFDISHTLGEETVASCVVFNAEGPLNSDYRRYNIQGITPGDDYAAMRQVLTRRYSKLKEKEGKLPEIIFIDGGKGQLTQAIEVLEELQFTDVKLVGVAKGEGRKPGLETLHIVGQEAAVHLEPDNEALHLIQHIRDEAHRFAITGHRKRRDKKRRTSHLEQIPGIGAKRRRDLLRFFGGLQGIERASIEELCKIEGINRELAKRIYEYLHGD